jgi:putative hydroxymethylpyrimidine transport system substrate-binding protein
MKRLAMLAALACLPLALAACGQKSNPLTPSAQRPFTLMLDWFPNADHVGLYQALAEGDFKRAGLNVHVEVPSNPATPLQLLTAGRVDMAISYEPQVLLARQQGEPLVSVAAIVQKPLTSIVSLGSRHIKTVKQLRGKTVGYAGIPYQQAYLNTILKDGHVPVSSVKLVNVGSNLVPALESGRVDAVIGAYWNYEAIQLRQAGKHPNVIHVENAGVPSYDELVLVTTEKALANSDKASELRRFVQALGRGYQSVRANPQAGVDALTKANPSLSAKLQLASVKATLPSFFPALPNRPWGWMPNAQWTAYGQWMLRQHLISNPATIVGASTDQLLAGQGP